MNTYKNAKELINITDLEKFCNWCDNMQNVKKQIKYTPSQKKFRIILDYQKL